MNRTLIVAGLIAALPATSLAQSDPAKAPASVATVMMPGPVAAKYGAPITLDQARRIAAAAQADARRRGVSAAIAIVDTAGDLVWFERMDDTQAGSIELARRKAETAALYRRKTSTYADALKAGNLGVLTLNVVASPGGFPVVDKDRVIGAIGVSGGVGPQDVDIATAGLAAF